MAGGKIQGRNVNDTSRNARDLDIEKAVALVGMIVSSPLVRIIMFYSCGTQDGFRETAILPVDTACASYLFTAAFLAKLDKAADITLNTLTCLDIETYVGDPPGARDVGGRKKQYVEQGWEIPLERLPPSTEPHARNY